MPHAPAVPVSKLAAACLSTIALVLCGTVLAGPAVLDVDFDKHETGPYTDTQVRADWAGLKWSGLKDRAEIAACTEADRGKCLRVHYPKGAVGPGDGGGQFLVGLPPRDEYWLEYWVKFEDGFDFRKGGKLPGLCGGDCNTGGRKPIGDGWSARFMWRQKGKLIVYLYHMDQKGKWGDQLALNCAAETGRWYRLTQRVKVNTPDQRNGELEVLVDGKQVLLRTDIRFRKGEQAPADHFYFSTFHGGGSADWAPKQDSFVRFDNIRIWHGAADAQ